MRLSDLGIRKKLLIVFSASSLFIGAIITVGLVNMISVKNTSREIYEEAFFAAQKFLKLNKDIEKSRRTLLTMLVETDAKRLDEYLKHVLDASMAVEDTLNYMLQDGHHFDPEALSGVRRLKSIWDEFRGTRDRVLVPAIYERRLEYATGIITGVQAERFREFIALSEAMVEHESREALVAQQRIGKRLNNAILIYVLITALGLLVAVTLLIVLSNDIGKRLQALTEAHARVKKGELDFKIEVRGGDEIGYLAGSFNTMVRQLYEDRINQEQSITLLNWNAEESEKKVVELERLNAALARTQDELKEKNRRLEESNLDIREMNEKLADTKAQMIQSAKMASVGQLSAGVAHEINNPIGFVSSNLNTLAGYLDDFVEILHMDAGVHAALREGRVDDAVSEAERIESHKKGIDLDFTMSDIGHLVQESRDGIERVVSIVKGLKDFSHAGERGKELCDLNKCLENTVKLCWHEIKYKAEVEKDFGAVPHVVCHPQRISQVFMNIIVNAAHAIPERGRICLKTFEEGGVVFIKIRDTGSGMSEEVKQRIFEPFFTTKQVGEGTGLGLSIAYGIVKEHEGRIEVESRPGEGTTFTISLPVEQSCKAAENSRA